MFIVQGSIPSEMMPAMRPLLDLARGSLWHWKTFPIILPTPITVQVVIECLYSDDSCVSLIVQDSTSTSTTSMTRKKTINIRDLFVEPNFHELEVSLKTKGGEIMKMKTHQAVATDSKGEPRKLNPAQLESIRQTGQFQVGGRLGLLLISLDWLRFEVWFCWGDVITRAGFSLL